MTLTEFQLEYHFFKIEVHNAFFKIWLCSRITEAQILTEKEMVKKQLRTVKIIPVREEIPRLE